MASLLSCTRTGRQTSAATVQLTFDTVRRNRQERVYIMDEKDAQVVSPSIISCPFYCYHVFYTDILSHIY